MIIPMISQFGPGENVIRMYNSVFFSQSLRCYGQESGYRPAASFGHFILSFSKLGVDDVDKLGLERGTANEEAVNVRALR